MSIRYVLLNGQTHEISTESLRGLGEWGWDISQDVIANTAAIAAGESSWLSQGTAAPTTAAHVAGEVVFNSAPAAGGNAGWICVTSGTPGTWKEFGLISL